MRRFIFIAAFVAALAGISGAADPGSFQFVILGDRTGETQPGVYERVWKETAADHPAFVVTVGDTIQGLNDATADAEWQEIQRILTPYRRFPLYLAPGNHDIWSARSEALFRKYSGHPVHYSFDYGQAHFTILDNSRSEHFSVEELAFLDKDLQAHAAQPLKFIVSHRPSWIFDVVFNNPHFAVHQPAIRGQDPLYLLPLCVRGGVVQALNRVSDSNHESGMVGGSFLPHALIHSRLCLAGPVAQDHKLERSGVRRSRDSRKSGYERCYENKSTHSNSQSVQSNRARSRSLRTRSTGNAWLCITM